jgi:uridine kinase
MSHRVHRACLLETLAERTLASRRNQPFRIGIDGLSATGKTTLADDLAAFLEPRAIHVLRAGLDNFKRPWSESHLYDRTSGEGYFRNAYDYDLIRADLLEPLLPGGSRRVRTKHIDPLTGQRWEAPPARVDDESLLIVDGVFLLRPELSSHWDMVVFLIMDFDLVQKRGADRDQAWEPSWEAAAELYRTRYIPSEQLYIHEVDPVSRADIVLDMTDPLFPVWLRG